MGVPGFVLGQLGDRPVYLSKFTPTQDAFIRSLMSGDSRDKIPTSNVIKVEVMVPNPRYSVYIREGYISGNVLTVISETVLDKPGISVQIIVPAVDWMPWEKDHVIHHLVVGTTSGLQSVLFGNRHYVFVDTYDEALKKVKGQKRAFKRKSKGSSK